MIHVIEETKEDQVEEEEEDLLVELQKNIDVGTIEAVLQNAVMIVVIDALKEKVEAHQRTDATGTTTVQEEVTLLIPILDLVRLPPDHPLGRDTHEETTDIKVVQEVTAEEKVPITTNIATAGLIPRNMRKLKTIGRINKGLTQTTIRTSVRATTTKSRNKCKVLCITTRTIEPRSNMRNRYLKRMHRFKKHLSLGISPQTTHNTTENAEY
jgi:hypothetical protein